MCKGQIKCLCTLIYVLRIYAIMLPPIESSVTHCSLSFIKMLVAINNLFDGK